MVKSKYLIVLSAAMLLVACGSKNEDSSSKNDKTESTNLSIDSVIDTSNADVSSVEEPIDGVTFEQFANIITNAAYNEAKLSSGGTYKSVDTAGTITDTVEYELEVCNDLSSYAKGTVVEMSSTSENTTKDEFIERRAVKATKIDDAGVIYDDEMFYSIRDYKNDCFAKNAYQDTAYRTFVIDNAGDDIDQSLYINTMEAKWALTLKATESIINIFDTYFYSNVYIDQLNLKTVHEEMGDEKYTYTISAEYQLDGDLNDTYTYKYELEVVTNFKKDRVLSYKALISSDDVSKVNPEDRYLSSTYTEVTVEYDTKEDKAPEDVPDVFDYYLHKVDSIKVVDYKGYKFEDYSMISPSNNFLFIEPVSYSPSTAMGVTKYTITPVSSSNTSAVKVSGATSSNPYFEIVGGGATTLTYQYFGMDEATGVFKNILGTVDVRISDTLAPTSISFINVWSEGEIVWDKEYQVGKNYDLEVRVNSGTTSLKVNQNYSVKSSDPDALEVYIDKESNNTVFVPKKEGDYVITFISDEDNSVTAEFPVKIVDNTTIDLSSVLCGNTWVYTDINSFDNPQFVNTVTFNEDGTGCLYQYITSTEQTYGPDTFTWTLNGPDLTVSDWSYYPKGETDIGYFIKGVISTDLTQLEVHGKNGGLYHYAIKN